MQDKEEKSGMVGRRTNGRTDGQEWSSVENAFSGFFSSVSVSRVKPPLFGSLTYIPPHLSAFFNSTNDVRAAFTHLVQVWKKKRSSDIGFPIDEKNLFALALFPPLWFGCQRECKKIVLREKYFFALRWNELLCWRILAMSWINYRISCNVVVVFFFNLIF